MQVDQQQITFPTYALTATDQELTVNPHDTPLPRLANGISRDEMFKPAGEYLNGKLSARGAHKNTGEIIDHKAQREPLARDCRTSSRLFAANDNHSLIINLIHCVGRLRLEQHKLLHPNMTKPDVNEQQVPQAPPSPTEPTIKALDDLKLTFDTRDLAANKQFRKILNSALEQKDLGISHRRLAHRLEKLERTLVAKPLTTAQWISLQSQLSQPAKDLLAHFVKETPKPSNTLPSQRLSPPQLSQLQQSLEVASTLKTLINIEQAKSRDFPIPANLDLEDPDARFEPNRRLEYELAHYNGYNLSLMVEHLRPVLSEAASEILASAAERQITVSDKEYDTTKTKYNAALQNYKDFASKLWNGATAYTTVRAALYLAA